MEPIDTRDAEIVTRKHMQRVSELLGQAAIVLIQRAAAHDLSKLEPVELVPLQRMQDLIAAEGQAPYGSDEYKRRTAMLGGMLAHHYANNSHHPEHYPGGINDMNLFDVIEMVLDWIAASERGGEAVVNLSASVERFDISPQLASVIRATLGHLGVQHK